MFPCIRFGFLCVLMSFVCGVICCWSTQQISQRREDKVLIFENAELRKEKFKTMEPPDRVAFCAEVLRARGEGWMRERLSATSGKRLRALAPNLGICVEDSRRRKKHLDPLRDEVMQLLLASTAACLRMSAGTAASSGPQTSTQQSSEQLREEEIISQRRGDKALIFENEERRKEKFKTMEEVSDRVAFFTARIITAFAALLSNGSVVTWGDQCSGGDSAAVQRQLQDVQWIYANRHAFAAILPDSCIVTWGASSCGGDSGSVRERVSFS
eukprot:s85_g35.t1